MASSDQQLDFEKIVQLLDKASREFLALNSTLSKPSSSQSNRTRTHGLVVALLAQLVKLFNKLSAHLDKALRSPLEDQSGLRSVIKSVPSLISTAWECLDCKNLCKLSTLEGGKVGQSAINKLASGRTRLVQSAMALVVRFYRSSLASMEFRFKLIQDNLENSEFLVRMDDEVKLEEDGGELDAFSRAQICTDEQRQGIRRALERAYERKRSAIKDTLARQHMLEFLGHPKEKLIADHLQELTDLMPDLSRQQLHLCLRHFGYDFERVLEALCERDTKLPLDLKVLLRISDTLEDVKRYEQRMLPAVDDNELLEERKSAEVGGFDLNALADAIKQLEESEGVVEVDGKVLLRQQFQRREKEQPTDAEKAALRAASMRFAMEEEEESDEDESEEGEEDDELRKMKAAEEERRFAAEIGHSGRFNRFGPSGVDPYEDEYDDSYEHAQLYSQVDAGATTNDEKETLGGGPQRRRAGERTKVAEQPQRQPKATTSRPEGKKGPPSGKKTTEPGKSAGEPSRKPPPTSSSHQQQSKASATTSSSAPAYTGGRERQLKERNKGKARQRGADRKAHGGGMKPPF